MLILSLLLMPNSSQAFTHLPVLASSAVDIASVPVNYLSTLLRAVWNKKTKPRQESLANRLSRISRIRLTPFKLVGYLGETQTFAAVGLDADGEIVHGAKFSWEAIDSSKLSIDEAGRATFLQPGKTKIICRAGSVAEEVTVLIRPLQRPLQSDANWKSDQDNLQVTDKSSAGMLNLLPALLEKFEPTASAQGTLGTDMGQSAAVGAVGNPRNAALEQTRLGSVMPGENFNMGIPLVNLGGRGLTASLSLYYNSRVWGGRFDQGLNTSVYTFDPIQSWPSPGFTLGVAGRIAYYDQQLDPTYTSTYALMLIDPDGTRHALGRVAANNPTTVQTTDGTHITYVGSVQGGGTLYFQDGTRVTMGFVNNRLLPTQIIDTNGNYISIAYKSSAMGFSPLAIDTVTDTLGRVIQFNYAGTGLSSISPPSGTGATFTYQTVTMNTDFQNGILTENVGSSFLGISGVTAPNRPPYAFTYSGYGMIYNVAWASGGITGSVNFNYPTGGEQLMMGPTFTQRTETATNSPTGVYTYANYGVITRPDGTTLTLTAGTNGIAQSELKNSSGVTFAKTVYTYANDPGGSPQVQSVTSYDETNLATKVEIDYDQYGNVTNKREYGEKIGGVWKVRRRAHYTYVPYQQYIDAYLRSLLMRVEIFDALENTYDLDDVLVQKTEYSYDGGTLVTYPGANPPGYSAGYVAAARGNQTATTEYTSLSGGGTSETHTTTRDMFGNVAKEQVSCCNEKSFTFGSNTYWSKPDAETKGNQASNHLTTTMEYNFTSGTLSEQTDPNGQVTTYGYSSEQNPNSTTRPTTATTSAAYNGWGLPTSSTRSYVEGGVTKNITTSTVYNGFGQPIQEINEHGGQVNLAYDAMGRLASRTNPFTQGGTPAPATTYTYDVLGRGTVITTPDNNTVTTTYNGKVTTVTDQVNRKTRRELDSLGRLIKVTEQDVSTGNLTQETTYTYDMADNLLQVNQGNQLRSFKYDTAGNLLFERIPEQTASINDGTGTYWSAKYTYTDSHKVATRTDARGVITTYGYDTLNRLTSITYNTSGATGVAATPTVTYNYDNVQTSATKGYLLSLTVGSNYTESYSYNVGSGGNGGNRISLSATTYTVNSRSYVVNYQYNNANQRTQVGHVYPEYDNKGRLLALKNSSGVAWQNSIAYNISGQVTGDTLNTSGTVVTESYGYNANRLQLTSQTATRGASLMNLTYNYNATAGQQGVGSTAGNNGQLMGVSGTINQINESTGYTYDVLGRLVTSNQTSNGATAQRRFENDRHGNRTNVYDATSGGNPIQRIDLEQNNNIPTNRLQRVHSQATNVAAASNGATASASSTLHGGTPASSVINGDHKGLNWGSGGGWHDNTGSAYPDWLQVNFSGSKTISEIDVYSIQDNFSNPSEPTEAMTFSLYGLTNFEVQYWDGKGWATVTGGNITGNNKVWRKVTFPSVTTDKIRVYITGTADGYSRLAEVEAYGSYVYDAAGNVLNDTLHSYQYDGENRVVSVDGGTTASYSYNQNNQRVKQITGAATMHSVWEGSRALAEYNGATGALLVQYVSNGNKMIAKIEGGVTRYFLSDGLSARLVLDAGGNVIGRQATLPFGEEFASNGTTDKHRFTNYERESYGVDYGVNRYYGYGVGGFMSVDPALDKGFKAARGMGCGGSNDYVRPQDLNRYSYSVNDPINHVDPMGLNLEWRPCSSPDVPNYCPPEFSSCEYDRCGNPSDGGWGDLGGGGGGGGGGGQGSSRCVTCCSIQTNICFGKFAACSALAYGIYALGLRACRKACREKSNSEEDLTKCMKKCKYDSYISLGIVLALCADGFNTCMKDRGKNCFPRCTC
jgi:RHS repeat-associated protein